MCHKIKGIPNENLDKSKISENYDIDELGM